MTDEEAREYVWKWVSAKTASPARSSCSKPVRGVSNAVRWH